MHNHSLVVSSQLPMIPLVVTTALVWVYITLSLWFVLRYRTERIIRSASMPFLALFVLIELTTCMNAVLHMIEESMFLSASVHVSFCVAKRWIVSMSATTQLSILLVRTHRIYLIFIKRGEKNYRILPTRVTGIRVLCFLLPHAIIMVAIELAYPPSSVECLYYAPLIWFSAMYWITLIATIGLLSFVIRGTPELYNAPISVLLTVIGVSGYVSAFLIPNLSTTSNSFITLIGTTWINTVFILPLIVRTICAKSNGGGDISKTKSPLSPTSLDLPGQMRRECNSPPRSPIETPMPTPRLILPTAPPVRRKSLISHAELKLAKVDNSTSDSMNAVEHMHIHATKSVISNDEMVTAKTLSMHPSSTIHHINSPVHVTTYARHLQVPGLHTSTCASLKSMESALIVCAHTGTGTETGTATMLPSALLTPKYNPIVSPDPLFIQEQDGDPSHECIKSESEQHLASRRNLYFHSTLSSCSATHPYGSNEQTCTAE
jgi:hypothetical protein